MKKILLLILSISVLGACAQKNDKKVVDNFINDVNKTKAYKLNGTMELLGDEEVFEYDIDVSYLKDNYYKVEMINKTNNHKQVIIKNSDGLYVVTPSLNKSFKFESNWPDNSSQAYILSSLINDIESDNNYTLNVEKEYNIIKTKVNYPNNDDLKYQKIYLDTKNNIKKVEVFGEADLPKIVVKFTDVDLRAGLKKEDFKLNNYITEGKCEEEACKTEETLGNIESAIYPLYMPANTYLSSSEVVNSGDESRVILTFSGDKNFVIVEERAASYEEHEIIPVYGEPLMLNDTIAALSSDSMYWTSNNVDYYITSENLSVSEMMFIAASLSNAQATIYTK